MSALQPTDLCIDLLMHPELGRIRSATPRFSWTVRASHDRAIQHAFQIQVATSRESLLSGAPDLWDSGEPDFTRAWATDSRCTAIPYEGRPLAPRSTNVWRVRTWTGASDQSPWSSPQSFTMAETLSDTGISTYRPAVTRVQPAEVVETEGGYTFVDFGRAAFATIELTVGAGAAAGADAEPAQRIRIRLGEVLTGTYEIERAPGGSRRFLELELQLDRGPGVYRVEIPQNERNTRSFAVPVHEDSFEVLPFRYVEIEGLADGIDPDGIVQLAVHYPFDDDAASFASSHPLLDEIWDFCRYSIKATSFLGIYIDGDRERVPYEADAYIDGLGHIACDREYSMLRRSIEFLIDQPTWPTEWQLYLVLAAWTDWMWSGDDRLVNKRFDDLEAKALVALRNADGLVDTSLADESFLESIHYMGASSEHFGVEAFRDVVDWPQVERDGHDIRPVNAIVNALHYRAIYCLADIAASTGREEKADRLRGMARQTRAAYTEYLVDPSSGLIIDGVGSEHSSLHSNMFAAAAGLVDADAAGPVREFIRAKGMACSVYGSQMLLEAVYALGDGDYGLTLLTGTGMRSWAHMIRDVGTTISLEAWDDSVKPNQDWNHAWGAAPAGIVPFGLLGVRPLEPGFANVLINPQTGGLSFASGTVPTVRGPIGVRVWDDGGSPYTVEVTIPANVTATVGLPFGSASANDSGPTGSASVLLDGRRSTAVVRDGRLYIDDIGSGVHTITLGGTQR